DLETALQALVRGAMTLLHGKHGLARIFELSSDESRVMVFVEAYADGKLDVRWHPAGHVLTGTFGGQLRDGGPPILVEDVWELDQARYPAYAAMRRQEMRSSVNVPIDAGGQRIGSLHVDHPQPRFFGPAELAAAGALAAQAGAAIERARVESARKEAQRRVESQARELAARDAEAVALKELDRLKDEFIRTISHELRTPLTVVHGYAQQLHARAHDLDPSTVYRFASTLKASSTRLKRLVEDLLHYARIEGGELAVREEVVDVGALLERIADEYSDEPGGERVVCRVSGGAGRLTVCADPEKVRIAVGNLVENALKYAPQGEIVLRAFRCSASRLDPSDPSDRAGEVVRVEVEDRGPGIPVREQPRIWERFYRGGAVAGLNVVPGSGIGLAVVKALVEAQRGRVGFTPRAHGSLFWLELPVTG
ncbi:MAG TPA: GAF domain-containing sensor histidine kinase, partial [Chloroflexota bacterium]|nr:GAF domain-containing sensor histidine kinase [Chloroflexota bacterium]